MQTPEQNQPPRRIGGSRKGCPNKNTKPLRKLAREYVEEILMLYADVMRGYVHSINPDTGQEKLTEATLEQRMTAAEALLNRGFGRPSQAVKLLSDEDDESRTFDDNLEVAFRRANNQLLELKASPVPVPVKTDAD